VGNCRHLRSGGHTEQGRSYQGLDCGQLQGLSALASGEPAKERDMRCAHERGRKHQDVADAGRVQTGCRHEQTDAEHAYRRGSEECRRKPSVATRDVHQTGDHNRQADDQSGVGRTRVGDAVGFQHQHRSLRRPQHRANATFLPRANACS